MRLSTKLFRRRSYRWGVVCFLMCFLFFSASVSIVTAGPEGAQVVNGQVTIQQSGSNTAITASDKAIINYSSFDIAQPETVRFIQPGSTASVLNRILSANPTNINGTLLANGRVFFVNPAGVYFGNGATINVNQLVASGLNISNADFINGRYNFAGGNGSVFNNGDISAQQVYLIGKQVTNSGNISCPAGYVVMAAGDRVFLGEPGSDIVLDVEGTSLSESANAAAPEVGVLNEGTIDAAGGIIALAAAGDIYSQAISNVGSLSTSADTGDAGQIKLTAAGGEVVNTGTIEASGSEGGQVAMEGARVGQFGTIHADGTTGNGGNVNLTASEVVALSSDSLTTTNAGLNGNGGEVIVYSPETALFRNGARIEAKGGSESGDGGFIEVSGKNHVEILGSANASAINGEAGTFLIDPTDIEVVGAGTATEDLSDPGSGDPRLFETTNATNEILDTVIEGLLNSGTSVTLDTSNWNTSTPGPYAGTGDITISEAIDPSYDGTDDGDVTLTLYAADDIIVNAVIDGTDLGGTSKLNVDLHANETFANTDDGDIAAGDVMVNAAIITDGGSFSSSGVNFASNSSGTITTAGGNVTLDHGGDVTVGATIDAGTGSVSVTAGGTINDAADDALVDIVADVLTLTATGEIGGTRALETTVASLDASSTSAGDIVITETDGITLADVDTADGAITINTGGATVVTDVAASGGGDEDDVTIIASAGDVTLGTVSAAGSGDITIEATTGSINENANNQNDNITTTGEVSLTAGTGIGSTTLDLSGVTNLSLNTNGSFDLSTDAVITDLKVTLDPAPSIGPNEDYVLVDNDEGTANLTFDVVDGGSDLSLNDVSVASGNLNFTMTTKTGNCEVGTVTVGGGTVGLIAAGAIDSAINDDTADIVAGTTNLTASSIGTTTTLDIDSSGSLNADTSAAGGNILIDLLSNTTVDNVTAGAGNVTLDATGYSINADTDDGTADISGATVNLTANAIGTTTALDIDSSVSLNADTSAAGGNILIDLLSNTTVDDVTAGTGDVTLDAIGYSINADTDDAIADISGAMVNLTANAIGMTTTLDIDSSGSFNADTSAANGNIIVDSIGDLPVGLVNAGTGDVVITASAGSINDAADDTAVDITGTTVALTAQDEIGGGTLALETAAASIEAHSTTTGDIIINETDDITFTNVDTTAGDIGVTAGGAINANSVIANDGSVSLTGNGLLTATNVQAVDSGTTGDYDITLETSAGGMDLQSVVADDDITATATAGDIEVVSPTAGDSISLQAIAGAITQNAGTITAGGSLSMKSKNDLSMADYTVANPGSTDLSLSSTGGTVTVANSAADDWQSISAAAKYNVVLSGDGDITTGDLESQFASSGVRIFTETGSGGSLIAQGTINSAGYVEVDVEGTASFDDTVTAGGNIELEAVGDLEINGDLTATGGGVYLYSETGSIYTPDSLDPAARVLDVSISGYSSSVAGVELDPDISGSGKAAIVIRTEEYLTLGSNAQLIAEGQYNPQYDDRSSVSFDSTGGGEPIDIAIYLRSYQEVPGGPSGRVAVNSKVTMTDNGTMVVDAGEKVTFGGAFNQSKFKQSQRLEVVSRKSYDLNEVIASRRLPYADNPEAIRDWFNQTSTGYFGGAYVLRGVKTLLAEVLALTNPVPLVPPRPLEPELRGEVEGPDTEALIELLSELGIGVQPYMTEAYADSLSTDLRLYKAAEKLQELMPVLEDVNGIHIAGLRETVAEFFPTLDVLSDERMDSFAQVLASHKGDETNYDLAGQCIFALTEYVNILGTDIGWPVETSVEFVMGRYVPRITENDEIRIAVIQMHLQKEL